MVQIIRAQHMGFCFGVRDALQLAADHPDAERTTIYGELVHNPIVNDQLSRSGYETVSETQRDQVPDRPQVMITAHGVSNKRRVQLQQAGKQIIDTTCPLVDRAHQAAAELIAEGYFLIILGRPKHVEILGITEDLPEGQFDVVGTLDAIKHYADQQRIGIIAQTTMPPDAAQRCRAEITRRNPHATLRWIDTICRPTRQRQSAVDSLATMVDLVIIIGGRNSNNTAALTARVQAAGTRGYQIESAEELNAGWFRRASRIGITAGTSTPDATIDSVESRIAEITSIGSEARPCYGDSCADWSRYFTRNLQTDPQIEWSDEPTLIPDRSADIARSIQTFQLGESGQGRHIRAAAERWVSGGGDVDYPEALALFLNEEHRHSDLLARFLRQEHLPLLRSQWSDSCFRFLRHLAGLRTSIIVLVTAEILAQVYYWALLNASDSPTLKSICRRVLRDERYHVWFQMGIADRLSEHWSPCFRWSIFQIERLLFAVSMRILWWDHRSVFRAANVTWQSYRKRCLRRFRASRHRGTR
ncbi:MAG: 4-hydroxy-3-methylbut-2-enyl diphosphate reductase [Planctomycetota bacterium]